MTKYISVLEALTQQLNKRFRIFEAGLRPVLLYLQNSTWKEMQIQLR